MTTDIEYNQVPTNGNGMEVQNIAMLGAMLAGTGLTDLEVQGLLGSVRDMALRQAMNSLPDVLNKIQRVQAARLTDILNRINSMPTMAGMVSRNHVIQIITSVLSSTPRPQ